VICSWCRARARPCRGTPYRARLASATGARWRSPRRPPPRYAACLMKLDSTIPAYNYTMAVLYGLVMLYSCKPYGDSSTRSVGMYDKQEL
jgi:hypothetical protein